MTPTKTERQSNAELLRILCILTILLHHFCVHALYPEIDSLEIAGTGWDSHLLLYSYAILYIGVNCFVLISGWFGIKLSWRGFINLYFVCAFYNLLASYSHLLSWETLMTVLFPFSHGQLWFIKCYFKLFLLAPLINPAIRYMNKRYYGLLLIALGVASLHYKEIWLNGYSLPHFIYLYLIGGFLHRVATEDRLRAHRWYYLGVYILSASVWGICTMLTAYGHTIPYWNVWAYNNPILLLTAIAFFLFIMSWQFQNKIVNRFALSTIGVYMLNEGVVGYSFLQPYAHAFHPLVQLLFLVGITLLFYLLFVGVDQIRIILAHLLLKRIP